MLAISLDENGLPVIQDGFSAKDRAVSREGGGPDQAKERAKEEFWKSLDARRKKAFSPQVEGETVRPGSWKEFRGRKMNDKSTPVYDRNYDFGTGLPASRAGGAPITGPDSLASRIMGMMKKAQSGQNPMFRAAGEPLGTANPMEYYRSVYGPDFEKWGKYLGILPGFNLRGANIPVAMSPDLGTHRGEMMAGTSAAPETILMGNAAVGAAQKGDQVPLGSAPLHEMLHYFTPNSVAGEINAEYLGEFNRAVRNLPKGAEARDILAQTTPHTGHLFSFLDYLTGNDRKGAYRGIEIGPKVTDLARRSAMRGGMGHPYQWIMKNLPQGTTMEEAIQSPMYDEAVNKLIEETGKQPDMDNRMWYQLLRSNPGLAKKIFRDLAQSDMPTNERIA